MSVSTALTSDADRPRVRRQRRHGERVRREHDERRLSRGAPLEQIEQLQLRAREPRRLDVAGIHRAGKIERDDERLVGTKRRHRQPLPRRPRERDDRDAPPRRAPRRARSGCRAAPRARRARAAASVASTTLRQPPPSARPRRSCQISQAPTGSSSNHSGRKKWNSAMAKLALGRGRARRATIASASRPSAPKAAASASTTAAPSGQ